MSSPSSPGRSEDPRHPAQPMERVRAMLRAGKSRLDILTMLVTEAERFTGGGAVASILLLDEHGLLRNGASPNLPRDYLNAIDRLKPDPNVGTCAAAAATGRVVITPDFSADNKWAELRHLPLALGFLGAWSTPILSLPPPASPAPRAPAATAECSKARVLGTFGIYYRERRKPRPDEIATLATLAEAAAHALIN